MIFLSEELRDEAKQDFLHKEAFATSANTAAPQPKKSQLSEGSKSKLFQDVDKIEMDKIGKIWTKTDSNG